jgi:hypothetical protein
MQPRLARARAWASRFVCGPSRPCRRGRVIGGPRSGPRRRGFDRPEGVPRPPTPRLRRAAAASRDAQPSGDEARGSPGDPRRRGAVMLRSTETAYIVCRFGPLGSRRGTNAPFGRDLRGCFEAHRVRRRDGREHRRSAPSRRGATQQHRVGPRSSRRSPRADGRTLIGAPRPCPGSRPGRRSMAAGDRRWQAGRLAGPCARVRCIDSDIVTISLSS